MKYSETWVVHRDEDLKNLDKKGWIKPSIIKINFADLMVKEELVSFPNLIYKCNALLRHVTVGKVITLSIWVRQSTTFDKSSNIWTEPGRVESGPTQWLLYTHSFFLLMGEHNIKTY